MVRASVPGAHDQGGERIVGVLREAIIYVKEGNKEGFMTFLEELYPYLPRPASVLTSAKAPQRRENSRDEQIHQTK